MTKVVRARDVRVVTVDDQASFRRVARDVIEATPGFEALGEAGSGEEALALVAEVDPDLVLVDVRMPGIDGIATTRGLCAAHPASRVVLISTEEFEELPAAARSCGAVAFIRKKDLGPFALQQVWAAYGRSSFEFVAGPG